MIMVTGDLHADLTRFKNPLLKKLKKNDALIIRGISTVYGAVTTRKRRY